MAAKSTFLVIGIYFKYKQAPKFGDKHWLLIQKGIKMGEKRKYVLFR